MFLFHLKSFFGTQIIYIFFLTFSHVGKRFNQKDEVNFKTYDVTTWESSNCNRHIAQCLKKLRQEDNEILSANII